MQHDRSSLAAPAIPIELVAGKQRRTVPVPRVYRITVTVPEGIERIRLQHGHARLHATVHHGRVEFTDVPAGACKLQGTNAKPIEFDLKDDRAIAMERTG